jgi:hypothetical protein
MITRRRGERGKKREGKRRIIMFLVKISKKICPTDVEI